MNVLSNLVKVSFSLEPAAGEVFEGHCPLTSPLAKDGRAVLASDALPRWYASTDVKLAATFPGHAAVKFIKLGYHISGVSVYNVVL